MPAIVEELFQGRTETVADKSTAEIQYLVTGAADEAEVKVAVIDGTPEYYGEMSRKAIEITERLNENSWKVTVRYETPEYNNEEEPEPTFSFDTGGGTQHITQSLLTVGKYPNDAPDLGGAIGFDGENVNGVDIVQPVMNFSETHWLKPAKMTSAYKKGIANITGTMNDGTFRDYDPGEVLFLGASGTRRGKDADSLWEVSYKFAVSPNRANFTVGDITVQQKYGWDYMWIRYANKIDNAKKSLIKRPVAVYVERVYKISEFSALGIGS